MSIFQRAARAESACRSAFFHILVLVAATLSLAGAARADLGASVTLASGAPTTIDPGEDTEIEITLSNSNDAAAITGVAFSNSLPGTLPDGLFVSGPHTYTCTDPLTGTTSAGLGSLNASGQALSLSGGVIPARANNQDGTCTIIVPVSAGSSDGAFRTLVYTIADGAVTGNDGAGVANSGAVSQSVNVNAMSAPQITAHAITGTLILGGAAQTLSFEVTNPNGFAITGFSFTNAFPLLGGNPAFEIASAPNTSVSCTGGAVAAFTSANAGDATFTVQGDLPANGTCTWSIDVTGLTTNGAFSNTVTNYIAPGSPWTNDLGIDLAAGSALGVTLQSPLLVGLNFPNAELATGESDTLTMSWRNLAASALTINSFLKSQLDGLGALGYGLTLDGVPTMSCGSSTAGTFALVGVNEGFQLSGPMTLDAGDTCTITIAFTGTVQTPGSTSTFTTAIDNTNFSVADLGGAAIVAQSASDSVLVGDAIRVSISSFPLSVAPGQPIRYQVRLENFGGSAVNAIDITDVLPAGTGFLTGTYDGYNYTPTLLGSGCAGLAEANALGATTADFTLGTLPARISVNQPSACVITYYIQAPATAGSVSNNLPAGAVSWNGGASSTPDATNTTTTASVETLAVVNSFAPASASEGTVSTLTMTFSNWSAAALANLSFSFQLPNDGVTGGQLVLAPVPNAATTCAGATISAVAGADTLAMSGGAVPARGAGGLGTEGSCFLTVDVIGPAGTYDNSFTVSAEALNADRSGPVTVTAASNTATLTLSSALSATKLFTPGAVRTGGTAQVIVRLANGGSAALTGVGMTDILPAGLSVAATPAPYSTCDGAPALAISPDASTLTMSGAHLPAGADCDVVFEVDAVSGGPWTNTIPLGGITADGGIINIVPVSAVLGLLGGDDLFLAKTTQPSSLSFPGETSRLTIEITNGSTAVTALSLTDHFTDDGTAGGTANGMVLTGNPQATTTCTGGVVSAVPGAASVTLSGASMTAAETCEVEVNVTSVTVGGITNIIPPAAIATAEGQSNGNQALTSLTTQSNLGVVKGFAPQVISAGGRSRLTITLYNPTTEPVAAIAVNDNLPAGMTVPAGANPQTTCAGGTVSAPTNGPVTMTGATLAAASGNTPASCTISVDVTAAAAGTLVNTIQAGDVTGTTAGQPVSNPVAAEGTLVVGDPLELQIAIDGLTLDGTIQSGAGFGTGSASSTVGTPEVLTIRIRNPGTGTLTGLELVDPLPAGLVLSTSPSGATTCSGGTVTAPVSGTTITLTGASLAPGAACTITANVLSNTPGSYVDVIPVGAISTNEGVSNAEATSAELIVLDPPEVGLEFDLPVIAPGGISTAIVSLGNPNDSPLTLTAPLVVDLPGAPGPILVAGTPNIGGTCAGTVTASAGGTTITYASGAVIPAGGCTIEVDVTGTVPGSYTGVIPAGDLDTDAGENADPATAPLAISTEGYISGKVFADNDAAPDGVFTPGTDAPLSGITIELHSGAGCSSLSQTTTTDASGNYLFFPLAAGTWSVCEPSQPANSFNGITTAGTIVTQGASTGTAGTASNPTATTSQIVGIVLGTDGSDTSGSPGNDFAEVLGSGIAGTVFLDNANDGVLNGSDAGIAGETVELVQGGTVIASTTTDANGDYAFTGLEPGTYTVRQPNQPADTGSGQTLPGSVPNGGTQGTATAPTVLPSEIAGIVLPPNTTAPDNDFAEIPNTRTISGYVFLDFGDDGALDGADYGLAGETVDLSGTDVNGGAVSETATTDANGRFEFAGLPEGTYTLSQPAQPADTTDGQTAAGSTGGTATAQGTTPSQIAGIDLTGANTVSGNNLFPEVPAAAPDLTVGITHAPASVAENGSVVFTVTSGNIGPVDTAGLVTITTTLPAGVTPTAASGTGWSCAIAGQVVTCTTSDVIAAGGAGNPITIDADIGAGLAGQVLTADALIGGGGEPASFAGNNTDDDPVAIGAGASVSGSIWRDTDHDRVRDAGEAAVAGWTVELLQGGTVIETATTDATGAYSFADLTPGSGYAIRFRDPDTGSIWGAAVPNEDGAAFTDGVVDGTTNPGGADLSDGTLTGLTLVAGVNVPEQSLPLDPAGVVYDAVSRAPVDGATVTISGPAGFGAGDVVGGSLSTTTGADGFYQFLLLPGAPAGTYTLSIASPATFLPAPSAILAPCAATLTVGAVPDPALVQTQATAPAAGQAVHDPATCPATSAGLAAGAASTQYFLSFVLTPGTSADVLNNHIPLDPADTSLFAVTKTTPSRDVYRGSVVPYTITATNGLPGAIADVTLTDIMPPGFSYRAGTATLDGVAVEPTVAGRTLTWPGIAFAAGETHTLRLMLSVGAGVGDGDYTNEAFAVNTANGATLSNIASATVRIAPDPVFDCADVIGKVFDDRNGNGIQEEGEPGLSQVTVSTVNGLLITTDAFGRYHVPCAAIPDAFRGSNFIMKLDESTLPFGFMMTSENPEVVRLTRGKAVKLNFGAAIYRLAKIELFEDAFTGTEPIAELANSIRLLPGTLSEAPTIVRFIHRGEGPEAQPRLDRLAALMRRAWDRDGCCYPLKIETEIQAAPLAAKSGK